MDVIKYSITIVEDISDEQYAQIVRGFKEYFNKKGFKVKSVIKYEGSAEIEFILEILQKPETLAAIGITAGIFIIEVFARNIIDEFYKKIRGEKLPKQKRKRANEIRSLLSQETSPKPELVYENVSQGALIESVKEPNDIFRKAEVLWKKINIEYESKVEKTEIYFNNELLLRKLSGSFGYKWEYYY